MKVPVRLASSGVLQVQQLAVQCHDELEVKGANVLSFKEHCSACMFQALSEHY